MTLDRRILSATNNIGVAPAVVLINPKYQENIAQILRACACFDIKQLWYTGDRVEFNNHRLPRELRLRDYLLTDIYHDDKFLERFPTTIKPVAIEFFKEEGAEVLPNFSHDFVNNIYIFGPEDGNIPSNILRECVSFVKIPTNFCINLAQAVNLTLYDRTSKLERRTNPWN